jgi:hypothetical protein
MEALFVSPSHPAQSRWEELEWHVMVDVYVGAVTRTAMQHALDHAECRHLYYMQPFIDACHFMIRCQ